MTTPHWPELDREAIGPTLDTMHRWAQAIGKVKLALVPHLNHFWEASLSVTPRGLTTGTIPCGDRTFAIDLDLCAHELRIACSDGATRTHELRAAPIASFVEELSTALAELGIQVRIWPVPVEVEDRTPLDVDDRPRAYEPAEAHRIWRTLERIEPVLQRFRARFIGKASPVLLYWGSFDLATTRFSGRPAPPHPGVPNLARRVVREAYSHEDASAGFWFGGAGFPEPAFFAYFYPEPPGFAVARVEPIAARYDHVLREFILPYADVRAAPDPEAALTRFLESTYAAGAEAAGWPRAVLERMEPTVPRPAGAPPSPPA